MSKPIKRHPALVHFSREHNFGLLLGWKLRQGITKSISLERISKYFIASFDAEILPHFENEEKQLFILLPANDPMRQQAEAEHKHIRAIISQIKQGNTSTEIMLRFTKAIDEHIRFEERQLFPHIEQQQSFEAYANAMAAHEEHGVVSFDKQWPDHFWK